MATLEGSSIPHTVLRYFDLAASPYTDVYIRDVAQRRASYPEASLFLDQLLGLASIDGHALYPPTSPADLRRLLHAVRAADIDRLKQDCFIYYLLLDADRVSSKTQPNGDTHPAPANGNGHPPNGVVLQVDKGKGKAKDPAMGGQAEEFARRRCLPQVWRGFIFGYWALDHGLWDEAVDALSNPAITSLNFLPNIFAVLSTHVSPPSHALFLVHALFTALSPPLDSDAMIHLRAISLASASSLSDAFSFIRSQPSETHRDLREIIYCWALGASRIPCGSGSPSVQPAVLTALLHLPLPPDESAHLTHFLTHPPRSISPQAINLLHELVTVRLIHQGQYAECLALDKELAGSGVGKEEDRQKRRERVKEFISILPEVQRRVLELDGEARRGDEGRRIESVDDDHENVEMRMGAPSPVNGHRQPNGNQNQLVVPIPTRPPFSLSQLGESSSSRPASPAPNRIIQPLARNVSSPFSGPPQFARTDSPGMGLGAPGTPTRSAPTPRLASGSPFNLPARSAVEVPRPARRIINDDAQAEAAEDAAKKKGERLRQVSARAKEKEAQPESEPVPENEPKPGQGTDVEMADAPPPQAEESNSAAAMPPPPVPNARPKPPTRKTSRQTLVPASKAAPEQRKDSSPSTEAPPPPAPANNRPSRRQTTAPPRADEDANGQADAPPAPTVKPPPRKAKAKSKADEAKDEASSSAREAEDIPREMPGAFASSGPSSSAPSGRSRLTRSASRAVLDDEQPNPGSPAKRPRTRTKTAPAAPGSPTASERSVRRGTRELSVASSVGAGGGRATRGTRASVTPGPMNGRGGSPTGSVASTRSTRGAGAGREGSMTPRATRTRK